MFIKNPQPISICSILLFSVLSSSATYGEAQFLKIKGDYYYSDWVPTGIEAVDYQTTGLNAFVAELDFTPMVEKFDFPIKFFPKIRRIWTPGNPATQGKLLSQRESLEGDNAIDRLDIELPFLEITEYDFIDAYFTKTAFIAGLTLEQDKPYTEYNGETINLNAGDNLSQLVEFERGGIFYRKNADEIYENFSYGIGLVKVNYEKPYSMILKGESQNDEIVDTRFSSEGIGFILAKDFASSSDTEFFVKLVAYYGPAEVKFSDNLSVNDFLADDETTTLTGLNVALRYNTEITEHILFSIEAEHDYYDFAVGKQYADGSIQTNKLANIVDINIDGVTSIHAGLMVQF